MGSLTTALASYLDAKKSQGQWLLRIEDIDPLREMPGASEAIVNTLDAHGLHWDENVYTQLDQSSRYEQAINQLIKSGAAYHCRCSRKDLAENNGYHLLTCFRHTPSPQSVRDTEPFAVRVAVKDCLTEWQDLVTGKQTHPLRQEIDDFVIKRKEGFYAYHLAVVCDDITQDITHIVRGADLLDSTPYHLYLYQQLNHPAPTYAHTPVICNDNGQKLSKQNLAPAIENQTARKNLYTAMRLLKMQPPQTLLTGSIESLLEWGIHHWSFQTLRDG